MKQTTLGILTFLFIALVIFLALYQLQPPKPVSEYVSAMEFSSARAMKHLEIIANQPHPIGSTAQAGVRNYILKQLAILGLSPQIQRTTVVNESFVVGAATVQNIVARLKGTDNSKAVMLVAHYDSVPVSPGANDDGAGVASILETARALKAGTPLKNDVIFLITDGHENGLLGAKAFVEEHTWLRDIGLVLNFEARGTGGASIMFEPSNKNGWIIREFARAAPYPIASSITYDLYKRLPNNTDFTRFKEKEISGLNFAYIGDSLYYHSTHDSYEKLDERSIQHHGSYAVALARHFGNLNLLNIKESDAIYFNFIWPQLIYYPTFWTAPLAVVVVLVFVGVIVLGLRKKQLKFSRTILSFLLFLLPVGASIGIVYLLWRKIQALHPEFGLLYLGDVYHSGLYMIGFVGLTIAITTGMYNWFRKKISVQNLMVGAAGWWLVLLAFSMRYLPGGSYLFTWPLLLSLIALGYLFLSTDSGTISLNQFVVVSICAIPGVFLFTQTLYLVFVGMTISLAPIIVVFVVIALGLLMPQLAFMASPNKWLSPGVCLLLSAAFIVVAIVVHRFDADHPKPNSILYGINEDDGKAIWVSADRAVDEWTAQFITPPVETGNLARLFPILGQQFLKSEAPRVQLPAPNISLLTDTTANDLRTLGMRIIPARQGSSVAVCLDSTTQVIAAEVNGRNINNGALRPQARTENRWALFYYGVPKEGIELTLKIMSSKSVGITVVDQSDGLPQIPGKFIKPRPAHMMPRQFFRSDVSLVRKSFVF